MPIALRKIRLGGKKCDSESFIAQYYKQTQLHSVHIIQTSLCTRWAANLNHLIHSVVQRAFRTGLEIYIASELKCSLIWYAENTRSSFHTRETKQQKPRASFGPSALLPSSGKDALKCSFCRPGQKKKEKMQTR